MDACGEQLGSRFYRVAAMTQTQHQVYSIIHLAGLLAFCDYLMKPRLTSLALAEDNLELVFNHLPSPGVADVHHL